MTTNVRDKATWALAMVSIVIAFGSAAIAYGSRNQQLTDLANEVHHLEQQVNTIQAELVQDLQIKGQH